MSERVCNACGWTGDLDDKHYCKQSGTALDFTHARFAAPEELPAMPEEHGTRHERFLWRLRSATVRNDTYTKARKLASPACGAYAGLTAIGLGIFSHWHWGMARAQVTADMLEAKTLIDISPFLLKWWKEAGQKQPLISLAQIGLALPGLCVRVPVAQMQAGDWIVCKDLNTTKGTDHITACESLIDAQHFYAVDNQKRDKYRRNIGAVSPGKTPAAYALRLR